MKGGEGTHQLAGLTVAIIVVLELPPRESCTLGGSRFLSADCFGIGA
jgi:hypothetical protein